MTLIMDTAKTITLSVLYPPGDANTDGTVDLVDAAKFIACAAGPGTTTLPDGVDPVEFDNLDTDRDGDVDLHDFAALQRHFGGTS